MFFIDKPYVSDFLIATIKKSNYRIVKTPVANELIPDESLNWISEEKASEYLNKNPETKVYSNSENALSWIIQNLSNSELSKHIQDLKNKGNFREMLKYIFPDFFFRIVSLDDIQTLRFNDIPFVIKPSVGFFSIGVHIVRNAEDWAVAKQKLNPDKLKSIFPKEVLDTSTFIIEKYIEGEEYAIDCYYNSKGEAVILNIMHHLFSSGTDTSDRVYCTSKDIICANKYSFLDFLNAIGQKAGLKNFPAHVEVRVDEKGQINPIETNPLRFGGWCTTADLLGIALDYNPYEYYFQNKKPDWDKIFENNKDKKFSIIVLNNNSGISPGKIKQFNYDLLASDFEEIIAIRKFDIKKVPIFGFVFAKTSIGNENELHDILVSNLRKYIETN